MAENKESSKAVLEEVVETEGKAAAESAAKTADEKVEKKIDKETKKTTAKTTTAKTTAKKSADTAKKTTTKKTPAKKTTKKVVKGEPTIGMTLQGPNQEFDIIERIKNDWTEKGHKVSEIEHIQTYVKLCDSAVYYVINGNPDLKGAIYY